jgi:hypothetical protein
MDPLFFFLERDNHFKIYLLKQLKKLFFRPEPLLTVYKSFNGLERIVIGSTELKHYNDSSNRYMFHESL